MEFKGMDTFQGRQLFQNCFCLLSEKGVYSGSKFFLYRVDPFSEGPQNAVKQIGSKKSCIPWQNLYKI